MENFEEILRKDLHQFLLSMKEVDERLPECPDVEEKWEEDSQRRYDNGLSREGVWLAGDDIRYLEEPYVPHNLSGVMAVNKPAMSEDPVWVKAARNK